MTTEIYSIPILLDTIYVLKDKGCIIIDSGDPKFLGKFLKRLKETPISISDIELIVLTHGHWDHIGNTSEIKELTDAGVLLHEEAMHFLSEDYPSQPPGLTVWGKILHLAFTLISPLLKFKKFEVDIIMNDEEFPLQTYGIPGRIIHTPGHSQGSVSVLLDSGEAFVGDLALNKFPGRLSPGLPIFGDDIEIVKESWRKLIAMGAETIYPAHGKPFSVAIIKKALEE